MDRPIYWSTAQLRTVDLLTGERSTMIALGKIIEATFGTSAAVEGLACSPTSPASLAVQVGPGQIFSQQEVDPNAYSSLPSDTTDLIMKQGIVLGNTTLNCPAPGTSGYSINYLVEATFQETDIDPVVLNYYNSANPTAPWPGPGGDGYPNYTLRQDQCVLQVKAGTAATTGSQTTPAPDSGYVGLYVVTVAYGQTTVTSGNISQYSGAPFLTKSMSQLANGQGSFKTEVTYTSGQTLPASIQGEGVVLAASGGGTFTLPPNSSFTDGGIAAFVGRANNQVIQPAGSDSLIVAGGTTVSSLTLNNGDSCLLVANGSGNWDLYSGSLQAAYAPSFTSWLSSYLSTNIQSLVAGCIAAVATAAGFSYSFGTNGYFKLPSWLGSFQLAWGQAYTATGSVTATYAHSFANGVFAGLSCIFGATTNQSTTTQIGTPGLSSTVLYANTNAGGPAGGTTLAYLVWGN